MALLFAPLVLYRAAFSWGSCATILVGSETDERLIRE
jgi:hypothetical protein